MDRLACFQVDPKSKGVVNPVMKGLFDSVRSLQPRPSAIETSKVIQAIVVPPIPGIGPVVDKKVSETFVSYVREKASGQRDAFMPRNVRHYLCPPLQKL